MQSVVVFLLRLLSPSSCSSIPLPFQRRESLQHNVCKRPQQRPPITTAVILAGFWGETLSLRKHGLALVLSDLPSFVFTLGRGDRGDLPFCWGASALVCLARFYLLLSPLRQKLATCSFLAECTFGMKILHSTEEKRRPENNRNLDKCKIA